MPEEQCLRTVAPARAPALRMVEERTVEQLLAQLQDYILFANIPAQTCAEIIAAARTEHFARRQMIYREGDPMRHVVLLTRGCAKVMQVGQNGAEVILRLHGVGEVVGKVGFGRQGRHGSMAQALSASTALVWETMVFEGLLQRIPELRRNMMNSFSKHLEELEERFREVSTENVASRLSREIIRLLQQVGRKVNGVVEISLSREELAQLVGTTLFTVSRLLSDWDARGIVSTRRETVSVSDMRALEELAETR